MVLRLDAAFSKADDATASIYGQYAYSAGCSIEQVFTPLEISKAGMSNQPGFRTPVNIGNDQGLFGPEGNVGPTNYELNPYFPKNMIQGDDGTAFFSNCDYNAVVMDPADDISLAKNTYRNEVHTVRTKGLRTPMLLSGWGFDLCDTPVPYVANGERRTFDTNLVNDRRYWKTGPLAVMWDEERQVWSGGPQILVGEALEDCAQGEIDNPEKFRVKLLRAGNSADTLVSYDEVVLASNRDENLTIKEGQWVVLSRINYEYIAIQAGGGGPAIFLGTYDGEWFKGAVKTVTQTQPATDETVTHKVRNLFADVNEAGSQATCAYAKIGTTYYLLATECEDA